MCDTNNNTKINLRFNLNGRQYVMPGLPLGLLLSLGLAVEVAPVMEDVLIVFGDTGLDEIDKIFLDALFGNLGVPDSTSPTLPQTPPPAPAPSYTPITDFELGDKFTSPTSADVVILAAQWGAYDDTDKGAEKLGPQYIRTYHYGGLGGNPLKPYSTRPMTRSKLLEDLNYHKSVKVGNVADRF